MGLFSIFNALLDRERIYGMPLSEAMPETIGARLPAYIAAMETRQLAVFIWAVLCCVLVILCISRVLTYVKEPKIMASALSKLVSPILLGICPFLLPSDVLYDSARYIGLAVGFAYCIVTTKLIFLSMAKMPFAVLQGDTYPLLLLSIWVRTDKRLTLLGSKSLFQLLCVWYVYRFSKWASVAMKQICARLDIYVFRIKDKTKKD
jgi:hypothetical protein